MKARGLGGVWVELVPDRVEGISSSSSSSRLKGDSSGAIVDSLRLIADSPAFDGGSVWLVGNSFDTVVESANLVAGSLGFEGGSGWLVGNWIKVPASLFRSRVASLVLETNLFVSEIGIRELVVYPLVVLVVLAGPREVSGASSVAIWDAWPLSLLSAGGQLAERTWPFTTAGRFTFGGLLDISRSPTKLELGIPFPTSTERPHDDFRCETCIAHAKYRVVQFRIQQGGTFLSMAHFAVLI